MGSGGDAGNYLLAATGGTVSAIFRLSWVKDCKGPVVEKALARKAGMSPPGFHDSVYSTCRMPGEGAVMTHSDLRKGMRTI